jgi:hypothetical protein
MVKLKPITDKSWLILADDGVQHVALLSEQRGKLILIAKNIKTVFNNRKELQDFFEEDIFENVIKDVKQEKISYYINGYPTDHNIPHEAKPDKIKSDLPLYTKTATSLVYYSAGYYCLQFPKGWMHAFCPKLETLTAHNYEGPFKTEKEMKFVLSKLRKCKK